MGFRHKNPRELQRDEDKWFKFFSPKQLIAAIACICVFGPFCLFINRIFGFMMAIPIAVVLLIICAIGIFFPIPEGNYLIGSGQNIAIIVFRCILRSMNKCVYVKGLNESVWEGEKICLK